MTTINPGKLAQSSDYLRYLALSCIQRANSGHPGLPLGCADLGVLLYRYILRYNSQDPMWANRDRFILSAGHGSMLLYPLLHFAGYKMTLKDLADFRQLNGNTPGHPEYEREIGIECTAGPLGQGFASAVGTAVEAKMLAQRFNEKDFALFDYYTYVLAGDGCMMEGISYEAASMAGHLGLDNLIAIYDSNHITIDGKTDITFTEDVGRRFEALGWHVDKVNISEPQTVFDKLRKLRELKGKPKMLIVTTTIGEGLDKKRDSSDIHGAPAGLDEIAFFIQNSPAIKELFENKFGADVVADTEKLKEKYAELLKDKDPLLEMREAQVFVQERLKELKPNYQHWQERLDAYKRKHPEKYELYRSFTNFALTDGLRRELLNYKEEKGDATRSVSGRVLNMCAEAIPQIVGGTADLAGSTKGFVKSSHEIRREDFSGRNIAFGVREHAMTALGNGLALGQTMIPFTSTFFTFFDYMKPSVRLAALMKLNHLFVFTHDSIYVGEDGPTHQPIEHLNSLRLLPDCHTFRPANDIETAFSYLYFLENMNGPVALVATRQKFSGVTFGAPADRERPELYEDFKKGGYVFYETDASAKPDIILCGSGSEVDLAMQTAKLVEKRDKKNVRVVSLPCLGLLNDAGEKYRKGLFGQFKVPVVLIEAASHRGVNLFYAPNVTVIDIQSFGVSAPGNVAAEHFGFTPEAVYKKVSRKLK